MTMRSNSYTLLCRNVFVLVFSFLLLIFAYIAEAGIGGCPGGSCSVRQPFDYAIVQRQTVKQEQHSSPVYAVPRRLDINEEDIIDVQYPLDTSKDEYISRDYSGPDGRRVRNDMDMNLFMRNVGGSDGAGLCVFTSIQHSIHYQGLGLYGYRKFMESRPGGGWPEKVDRTLKEFASSKGLKLPTYRHIYGLNNMDVIECAVNSGKMVCSTWGTDYSHYGGSTIAHMVNIVYIDKYWGAILDNNFPNEFLWVKRPTFDKYIAWSGRSGKDGSWFIVFDVNGIPVREAKK